MKLGFFGGSFNPPHKGHQYIIEYCQFFFDKFLVIPNYNSPDNNKNISISYEHRVNMLKLKNHKIEIDDFEMKSNGINYTCYTIEYLIRKYSDYKISMVIGEDQFNNLSNWYNIDFILNNVEILCFKRKNKFEKLDIAYDINMIDLDFPYSSAEVRKKLKMGENIDSKIVDKQVLNYIKENRLYI